MEESTSHMGSQPINKKHSEPSVKKRTKANDPHCPYLPQRMPANAAHAPILFSSNRTSCSKACTRCLTMKSDHRMDRPQVICGIHEWHAPIPTFLLTQRHVPAAPC